MTNPFKLNFSLRQHTPLIHFQQEQHGATLRATELKPKLDKFLIDQAFGGILNYQDFWKYLSGKTDKDLKKVKQELADIEQKHKGDQDSLKAKQVRFLEEQKLAFDYKVKISSSKNSTYFLPLPLSLHSGRYPNKGKNLETFLQDKTGKNISILAPCPYFANADKIKFNGNVPDKCQTKVEELRFAIKDEENIRVDIFTFHTDLKKELEEYVVVFFLKNNFGTRQNKGFGSFTVDKLNGKTVKLEEKHFEKKLNHRDNNIHELFSLLHDEYQLLKSGKNYPKYRKSKLFEHFIENKIRWEKRFIKQKINTNRIEGKVLFWKNCNAPIDTIDATKDHYNEWVDKQQNNYHYIRALLGLAEQYEYTVFVDEKSKESDNRKKYVDEKSKESDNRKKYIVSVNHLPRSGKKEDKIERFKSPIFFKIIDGYIYINYNKTYERILGEEFEFTLKLKGGPIDTSKCLGRLSIPNEFDIEDFINNSLSDKWETLNNK